MSENTQPTNSTKFAPMPVTALLANIVTLESADVDSSYTSIEDSDDSFSTQVTSKTPQSERKYTQKDSAYKQKTVFSSTPNSKMKSSTKKITPGSTQRSTKKTPLQVVNTNKNSARCE